MRWMVWFIFAYVLLGVQLGLGGFVQIGGAWPNLVLLGVIFIAINAPREPALLACFCMGALQDLLTQQPFGVYALAYGIVALLLAPMRSVVHRKHPLTHILLALAAAVAVGIVQLLQGWIHPPAMVGAAEGSKLLPAARISVVLIFKNALYTAVVAPVVLGILQRMTGLFAFEPVRRRVHSY